MTKIKLGLFGVALTATMACAGDSAMYIGADFGSVALDRTFDLNNGAGTSYSSSTGSDKATQTAIKLGLGKFEENRIEFGLYSMTSKNKESGTTLFESATEMGISLDYLITTPSLTKSFLPSLMPYVKVGCSLSQADLGFQVIGSTGQITDKIYAAGMTVGMGVAYKIGAGFEVQGGFDYTYKKWEDLTSGSYVFSTSDKAKKLYVGLNYRF